MQKQEIKQLLEKFRSGTLLIAEARMLLEVLDDPELLSEVESQLEAEFMKDFQQVPRPPEHNQRLSDRVLGEIHRQASTEGIEQIKIRPLHRLNWLKYAAVFILVSSTAFYLLQSRKVAEPAPLRVVAAGSGEIRPGIDQARLTLADGTVVVLDSTKKRQFAQQGGSKISNPSAGVLAYQINAATTTTEILYNTLATPKGGQYQLVLSDGSKVWLNAGSSLRFPAAFAGPTRSVDLTGEAYFEVAKNTTKPFVVNTAAVAIKVHGTTFNVNAYKNEAFTKTTLCEGSISVSTKTKNLLLTPGQQAISKPHGIAVLDHVNMDQALAWKNGLFYFYDADLFAVMRQVERWYDITVVYPGNPPAFRFRGKLPRDLSFNQVLKILSESEVKFTLQERTLTILPG